MTTFQVYDGRAGRYWKKSIAELERLERQHQEALQRAADDTGYYPNRDADIEKHARLLKEIRSVRSAKLLQIALL